jgi:hypothetical protein
MAEQIRSKNTKDFWKDVKKMKGSQNSVPNKIDDTNGSQNIANLFASKFSQLYNSVSYDHSNMLELKSCVSDDIKHKCKSSQCSTKCTHHIKCITVDDVKRGIKQLKHDKKDGTMNLYTNHLINGTDRLFVMLSLLFTAILVHGFCPDSMLYGTMTPIPKVTGSTLSDNFRAITLCSTMSKLFDVIILNKCKNVMTTSDLQFGFKAHSSTTACTFAVQEVISYYNDHKTNVICTLLDASKAFDRIEYCTLFRKLIERNLCPVIIRLLLYMYLNQSLVVKWNGCYSSRFNVSNGVKQGGIISPILFCIYINDLLQSLETKGVGCYIGANYCGAFGYADDIILLCPSIQGTKEMLETCQDYATNHNILFNVNKSQVIVFPHKSNLCIDINVCMNDQPIPVVSKVKHLGHMLSNSVNDILDVTYIGSCFNRSVNMLLANFGSVSADILSMLFTHYCTNFYGITLCNTRSKYFNDFHILWRKAVKRILRLPFRTHNALLPSIFGTNDLDTIVFIRILKFYQSLLESPNPLLRDLGSRCQNQCMSNMGNNISVLCTKYELDINSVLDIPMIFNATVPDETKATADACAELINIRDGRSDSIITYDECKELLHYLCIS